jgi:hypothetical protein
MQYESVDCCIHEVDNKDLFDALEEGRCATVNVCTRRECRRPFSSYHTLMLTSQQAEKIREVTSGMLWFHRIPGIQFQLDAERVSKTTKAGGGKPKREDLSKFSDLVKEATREELEALLLLVSDTITARCHR